MHAHLDTARELAGRSTAMIPIVAPAVSSRARCAATWLSRETMGKHTGQNMGGRLRRRIEVRPS